MADKMRPQADKVKPRAFKPAPEPQSHIVVDERLMTVLSERAHQLYLDDRRSRSAGYYWYQALHEHMTRLGAQANFEVKV